MDEIDELVDDTSQDWIELPDGSRRFNEAHFRRVEKRVDQLMKLADHRGIDAQAVTRRRQYDRRCHDWVAGWP
jgi:hypothetical protein